MMTALIHQEMEDFGGCGGVQKRLVGRGEGEQFRGGSWKQSKCKHSLAARIPKLLVLQRQGTHGTHGAVPHKHPSEAHTSGGHRRVQAAGPAQRRESVPTFCSPDESAGSSCQPSSWTHPGPASSSPSSALRMGRDLTMLHHPGGCCP